MYYKLLFYNIRIEHQFYYLLLFLFLAGNIFVTALIKADLVLHLGIILCYIIKNREKTVCTELDRPHCWYMCCVLYAGMLVCKSSIQSCIGVIYSIWHRKPLHWCHFKIQNVQFQQYARTSVDYQRTTVDLLTT